MTRKGQHRYYVKLWDATTASYSTPRSVESVARELDLDRTAFPPTSRTGALLIGEELRKRGGNQARKKALLYADYCDEFLNWDLSSYIQGKLARGQRIGREYVAHNASYVRTYIRPAFPALPLAGMKTHMLETFAMRLKRETDLSNRSINAILMAASVPLGEAARLGLIEVNPAANLHKLGDDTREKGIPTVEEIKALMNLTDLDPRIRCAILLGSACALRLGEIQAIRLGDIGAATVTVQHSWGKLDGLKGTKTSRARIVPLPQLVRAALLDLASRNPHGPEGFLLFGKNPNTPLDARALERGFYSALERVGIDESARVERSLSFHSLRHWNNAMLRGTLSDEKLRLITGHSTTAMTQHYDHITESDLEEMAQAQERRLLPLIAP